jgi:hypothetical protein
VRLVKRQELMRLPTGTLFCELHEPWAFGGLQLKMDTIEHLGKNIDFWVRSLDWPEADDTGMAINRLDEMAADGNVGYPIETAETRHGLYDDDVLYLVYEQADTAALIELLGPR